MLRHAFPAINALRPCRLLFAVGLLAFFSLGAGCASPSVAPSTRPEGIKDNTVRSIRDLRIALLALDPKVSAREANRVAERAHTVPRQLARDYGAAGSPHFHNFLVNTGLRKRGLCFQWTEDLMRELQALRLTTLELHWAEARPQTLREHNCVVVTARGQPFTQGIVLDGWRYSGRLFWSSLSSDHHYPWRKNDTDYMRRVFGESSRHPSAHSSDVDVSPRKRVSLLP